MTGVRYSRTDSAVPYTVTVYSAYFIRSTARISFTVWNPGNLGCALYRTETAAELTVPHTSLTAWQMSCFGYGSHLCNLPFSFTSCSLQWTVALPYCLNLNVIGNIFLEFVLSFEFLLHRHKYILTPYKHFALRRTKTGTKKHLPEDKCCRCCIRKETHNFEVSTEFCFECFLHIF